MSAFIVGRDHIEYLVGAGLHMKSAVINHQRKWRFDEEWKTLTEQNATEVGQMLWDENIASVKARYPNETTGSLPGPVGETFKYEHKGKMNARYDAVQVIKAAHCLECQSCEHKGWRKSEARSFLRMLEQEAIRALPGYDKAEWGPPKALRTLAEAEEANRDFERALHKQHGRDSADERRQRRKEVCEQIVLAIEEWWSEGDAPLHADTQIFADKSLLETVRAAVEIC